MKQNRINAIIQFKKNILPSLIQIQTFISNTNDMHKTKIYFNKHILKHKYFKSIGMLYLKKYIAERIYF